MPTLRLLVSSCAALAALSCSTGSSVPSPLPPGGGSGETTSISGTVVSHLNPSPVSGATLIHGVSATATNTQGAFTLNGLPLSGAAGVTVNAPGHVFRRVVFDMAPNRSGVLIDIIRDQAPFDLLFYRMWVRDALESTSLQPTRPWTADPNFYFRTVLTDDEEESVPDEVIDRLVGIFANSVIELSGGRRRIGVVERGVGARELEDGWVNVTFAQNLLGALGRSTVGGNSGTIALVYAPALLPTPFNNPFDCEFYMYSIADHEITHTMGFWHTLDVIGDSFSGPGCTGTGRPERTRMHSGIMYSRPAGNTDPDVDPPSALQSQAPGAGAGRVVECFRH